MAHLYSAPSRYLLRSVLCTGLVDATNECVRLVSKTMHSELKESPLAGPRILVEIAKGFPSMVIR